MFRLSVILLFLAISVPAFCQQLMHYDLTDGLSSIEVNDIKENDNFLWIATSDGLNRFDGENFRVYRRNSGQENSLSGNNIETLYFDSGGYLWIGLKTGGVDIYDSRHDRFYQLSKLVKGQLPGRVITICEDSDKNIWLGTWEEGVYRLIPDGTGKMSFISEIHYPGFIVSTITEKPRGFVRFGSYSGMFVYSLAKHDWIFSGLNDASSTQFIDDADPNSLWCSTWSSGLLRLSWPSDNPGKMTISARYNDKEFRSIHRIVRGDDNKIYLGTWGYGVSIFDPGHPGKPVALQSEKAAPPLINCLFRDHSGNIWIGSFGGGISKYNTRNDFLKYFPSSGSLPAPAVVLAGAGNNRILAGTQGKGIYMYDLLREDISPVYRHSPEDGFSNYILSVYADDDYILAGHDGRGFPFYRMTDGKKLPQFREFSGISEFEKITAFFPGRTDHFWVGTKQNGLFSFRFGLNGAAPDEVNHNISFGRDEITGFAPFRGNEIFISSHNGLFRFNTLSGTTVEQGRIISNEIVYRILRDDPGNCLWIGTSTNLMKLDLSAPDTAKKAIPDDIIPQGAIRVILPDRENNIWFAVQDHLFCLVRKENRVVELNPLLIGKKAILSGTTASSGGTEYLVFGTTEKLILIDPAKMLLHTRPPSVLLTALDIDYRRVGVGQKVYGNVILNEATEYTKSIRLSHKCRWISLSFAEKNSAICQDKFQFRIKGFSDNWQFLDLSDPVVVSQLNPGKYVFQIRRYGVEMDTGICWSLETIIVPPWWKTTWFYVLLAIAVAAVIALSAWSIVIHFRKRHIARLREMEKEKEAEIMKEKESFFAGLSHDLMTPFSLIMSPVNDLLRDSKADDPRKEKLEIISKNTSFLSDIFSTILDFKRAELSDDQVKNVSIEIVSFSRMVLNAFEYLAGSGNIQLSFASNTESLTVTTDNVKIERILYNLLGNAIKYTPEGGQVELRLDYDFAGSLMLIVSDTGCGMDERNQSVFEKFYREPGKKGSGFGLGLYIVRKFITLLNGSISIKSRPGEGTVITVKLPLVADNTELVSGDWPAGITMDETLSTVLIAEDNDQMRDYMSKKLGARFNVIPVSNGNDAMAAIRKYLPEIVISDVLMPGMDGLTLCRNIKENSRYSDILVCLVSAKASPEDELAAYRGGADVFIRKPFDTEVLLKQMINIHTTRQKRKSQLIADLLSKEKAEIEFDPKDSFIKRSMKIVEENIMDSEFKIDKFASEMNMSNTVLHRKFRLLVGETPNQFIKLVRLRRSVALLRDSDHTIAEIAHLTGFSQSHYYIKCFREVYNDTPRNYREQLRQDNER